MSFLKNGIQNAKNKIIIYAFIKCLQNNDLPCIWCINSECNNIDNHLKPKLYSLLTALVLIFKLQMKPNYYTLLDKIIVSI